MNSRSMSLATVGKVEISKVGSGCFSIDRRREYVFHEHNGFCESTMVRGNDVDGYGAGTAIVVFADTCTFTDNRCVLQTVAETVAPHVSIIAGAVIAGSNQIQTQSRGIALALHVNVERCTVLGNIVTGRIQINGVDLGNPWRPLNVL